MLNHNNNNQTKNQNSWQQALKRAWKKNHQTYQIISQINLIKLFKISLQRLQKVLSYKKKLIKIFNLQNKFNFLKKDNLSKVQNNRVKVIMKMLELVC